MRKKVRRRGRKRMESEGIRDLEGKEKEEREYVNGSRGWKG